MKEIISYVPLAKSIPEYSKRDGSVYTCSLGYSTEKGLIRVYPIPLKGMYKWNIYKIPVERNKRDSRMESFKLASYSRKNDFIGLSNDVKQIGIIRNKQALIQQLSNNIYPSISRMNELRISIGLIKVNEYNVFWDNNDRFINTTQIGMFDDVEIADFTKYTKETKMKESRIKFKDADGLHNLQFNEWQYYEFQRKYGYELDAFRNINGRGEKYLLLGNMNGYRMNWIGLGFFNLITENILMLNL
jgi:hypothetical protein